MGVGFVGQATRAIVVEEATQAGQVRREAQELARLAGFGELDAGRVTLVAMEVATNVLRHGRGGRVLLALVQGRTGLGVEVCGIDRGPGFSLANCLPDGYSTGGTPGQGLGAIKRQSQVFDAWSDARGAVVLARIYGERTRDEDLGYGALRVPMRQETVCGDAWYLGADGDRVSGALVDGLGHGLLAAEAAETGIAAAAEAAGLDVEEVVARMHARMSSTRGGAAAAFIHDPGAGVVRFAGVGNIAAAIHEPGMPGRGLASHPGIVGSQYRRAPAFVVPATPGALLLMHSDGLQTRWSLAQYEGLAFRHPALVLAVLLRDFDRGRDDTSALAVRLGGRT
ncbi:ATP-binding protein [Pseudoxanthomonas suwonensis]|uniref:ATP-binding protein n=1 Tax=Pseudoxanthomonas suwonensis TaxID=314722 RepID=UPI00138F3C8E|nr:ATP-binding protein [Pseudoxanthomonas suwonensis]